MTTYFITFDLHDVQQPVEGLYRDIWHEIELEFGSEFFCKKFLQFGLVVSSRSAAEVRLVVKGVLDKKSNRFASKDIVVFSTGEDISISRGHHVDSDGDERIRIFRKFFVEGTKRRVL